MRCCRSGSWVVLACQLLLAACSGETGKSNGSGGSSTSGGGQGTGGSAGSVGVANASDLDSFLVAEGEGFCARLFRCFEGNDDFSSQRLILKTEQGCKDALARINASSRSMADLRVQLAAGRLRYDPKSGAECLADLARCNGASSLYDGACREVLEGDAKPGEACQRSEECAGDAYCSISGACPGVCAARKAEGEPCDRDNDCAYAGGAVFCDHSQATPVCHTLAPRAKAAEGEPCTRNLEGADSLTLCQDDLWCAELPGGDPRTDVLGRCSLPIAENAACLDSDDVCSDGMCKEDTKLCQRVVVLQKAGAACDKAAFAICDPTLGLRCSSGGVCIAAGSGSEGSTCFTGDLQRACDPGLYCAKAPQASADETGTCRALLATAEVCAGSNDCASASCVDGVCDARPCLR